MAARRPYMGYGSAKPIPMAPSQRAPLPPPPDGQAPVRLAIGDDEPPYDVMTDVDDEGNSRMFYDIMKRKGFL